MIRGRFLFILDDVNYNGGAHAATLQLVRHLMDGGNKCIVFSRSYPSTKTSAIRFGGIDIRSPGIQNERFDQIAIDVVLRSNEFPVFKKIQRIVIGVLKRAGLYYPTLDAGEKHLLQSLFRKCSNVVVVGENSRFIGFVARNCPVRKIVMIHTDYDAMAKFEHYTVLRRWHDIKNFSMMDVIGIVGEETCKRFRARHPFLAGKCLPFLNYISEVRTVRTFNVKRGRVKILTLSRFDANKDVSRLLRIAERLKKKNIDFSWDIFGDGPLFYKATCEWRSRNLEDVVRLPGYIENSKIHFHEYMVLVAASHYEGRPLTVVEASRFKIPVLATDVGDVRSLIDDGNTGWIVEDSEDDLFCCLCKILSDKRLIAQAADNLCNREHVYDNNKVNMLYKSLLEL